MVSLRPTVDLVDELQRHKPTRQGAVAAFEVRLADTIPAADGGSYDTALLLAPHYLGNERRAYGHRPPPHRALRPDGALFFQAHRRQGGETFARYAAERFGSVELLAIRSGHRLYRAVRGPGPPASVSDEGEPETVVLQETVRGLTISLETQAGVFFTPPVRYGLPSPGPRRWRSVRQTRWRTSDAAPDCWGLWRPASHHRARSVLLDNRVQTVALAKNANLQTQTVWPTRPCN